MKNPPGGSSLDVATTDAVLKAIRSIRYGAVEIVIHDGRIVAIERWEKVRLNKELAR
ncbi:MAG: YezD family protein [Gemmatimonadota bacterium]